MRSVVKTSLTLRQILAKYGRTVPYCWAAFDHEYRLVDYPMMLQTLVKVVDNRGDGVVEDLDRLLDAPGWQYRDDMPGIYWIDDPWIPQHSSQHRCCLLDYVHDGTQPYEVRWRRRQMQAKP